MNCFQVRDLLTLYLDDELQLQERQELEAHLNECKDCAAILETIRNLSSELKNLPEIQPSPELLNRLYLIGSGQSTESAPVRPVLPARSFWKIWLYPAFQPVLTFLAVVLIGLSLLQFTATGRNLKKSAVLEIRRAYSTTQKILAQTGLVKDRLRGSYENLLASLEAREVYKSENN